MRPNLSNAEDMCETRNIRREEVYIAEKIKTLNAGRHFIRPCNLAPP